MCFHESCGRWRITQTLRPRAQEILPSLWTLTNEAALTRVMRAVVPILLLLLLLCCILLLLLDLS